MPPADRSELPPRDDESPAAERWRHGDTRIWDEASQRYMERFVRSRKQAAQLDYHDLRRGTGNGVTRGDTGVD
jgi:hypothetical protein